MTTNGTTARVPNNISNCKQSTADAFHSYLLIGLQVFFKLVVTKIDPKYLTVHDNYREFENIHLQQGDRERRP